jgi:hypothetical protein
MVTNIILRVHIYICQSCISSKSFQIHQLLGGGELWLICLTNIGQFQW